MALRHPWFTPSLKRKCPDDLLSSEGNNGFSGGGDGFGVVGTVYGGLPINAYNVAQTPQPHQTPNSNGRATKRIRKFASRNLERGFAELSIQPTQHVSSPPTHPQHQHQIPDTQVECEGAWNDVIGNVAQGTNVLCPDGSTLPLVRSSVVDEPPEPEVDDVQMSTSTWYEPEKDRIVVTSLDDDDYDGDDEGQQQRRAGTKSAPHGSGFTISPAFLNAINKKLTRRVDPPAPLSKDAPTSQALVLFRPLPSIAPLPADDERKNVSNNNEEEIMDSSMLKPPPITPLESSPFHVQGPGQPSFVFNDDAMEIEML